MLFVRSADGAKVFVDRRWTSVEVSVPRWLEGSNLHVGAVPESGLLRALHEVTYELLPITTRSARLAGEEWGIVKLALALDVWAPVAEYVSAYSSCRWSAARTAAKRYSSKSLVWSGSQNRLTLYDKGQQMIDCGYPGGPDPNTLMRIERQWQSARAMDRLASVLRGLPGQQAPFVVDRGGRRHIERLPVGSGALHFALAGELDLLDAPLPPNAHFVHAVTVHLTECERFSERLSSVACKKTVSNYRRRALHLEVQQRSLVPLNRIYSARPEGEPEVHDGID